MRVLISLLFSFLILSLAEPSCAQTNEATLIGLWQTKDKEAVIEFYRCEGDEFCGRFYWLKDDSLSEPSLDDKNPDPELKKRPLCGLTFLGGFTDKGDGDYGSGWVYSARHGSKFSASVKLIDQDTLELRGFMFVPFLGRSEEWQRVVQSPQCALLS
ncbi:MAG: DUF2147 domain-containing protein [Proteobacteria bacterium]|jgi:uncharacterized protein (DUF2147 family)|nr:DUF2147 domain-containing protein [Alphaproteobacteria bacterium]NCC03012.1 DUF2147 domain-containing protein [Pseudomonadota bacterium]